MLILSGTPDFTPFGGVHDFIHSLLYYIICQSNVYVYRLMTGLFAWISPTALSWTYCITVMTYCFCLLCVLLTVRVRNMKYITIIALVSRMKTVFCYNSIVEVAFGVSHVVLFCVLPELGVSHTSPVLAYHLRGLLTIVLKRQIWQIRHFSCPVILPQSTQRRYGLSQK